MNRSTLVLCSCACSALIHAQQPQRAVNLSDAPLVFSPRTFVHATTKPVEPDFLGGVNPKLPEIKARKLVLNERTAEPAGSHGEDEEDGARANQPDLGFNFNGIEPDGSNPRDNSIAISDNDRIVSANNSGLYFHDVTGELIDSFTWTELTGEGCYDPRVLYDGELNRFILAVLHGNTPGTSRLHLCFSTTSDPEDPWNIYTYEAGDFADDLTAGCWFDFPAIGVSDDEVFVTLNVFTYPDDAFIHSIVLQLDLSDAYAGTGMNGLTWGPVEEYHLTPAPNGYSGSFSAGQYFVVSNSGGGSNVRVHRITDRIQDDPDWQTSIVDVADYDLPSDAHMPGTSNRLDVGNCSIRSAYYLSNYIHCALITSSDDISKIRYIRIHTTDMSSYSSTFYSSADIYMAYPSLVPYSNADEESIFDVIVVYQMSDNDDHYPGMRVVHFDGEDWSSSRNVRSGDDYISYSSDAVQRWGDYTTACRDHTSGTPPIVWVVGSYANADRHYRTRIAQVSLSSITGAEEAMAPIAGTVLSPNPATDQLAYDFLFKGDDVLTINLVNVNGALVRQLYAGTPRSGRNRLVFPVNDLAPGLYSVVSSTSGRLLEAQRLVVQ